MKIEQQVLDLLKDYDVSVNLTGSVYICDPAPKDTDTDYLVYFSESTDVVSDAVDEICALGWTKEGDDAYETLCETQFCSLRKEKVNLIVTNIKSFVKRHQSATAICKKLNLLKKEDRIMVFKAVLYNELSDDMKIENIFKKEVEISK